MSTLRFSCLLSFTIAFASLAPAAAQTCKERFIKAATEGNGEGQYRQIVTQRIGDGQQETVQEFIMNSHRHWVTKSIEPKALGWTLLHDDVMYSSSDEGTSWREIAKFDEKAAATAREQQKQDVENVTQVECAPETIDGRALDRVHGQYEVTVGFKSSQIHTYWLDPVSGLIIRSNYETKSPSFKSTVSQKMIPFGDAEVPVP